MPGLSAVYGANPNKESLNDLVIIEETKFINLIDSKNFHVFFSSFNNYPLKEFDNGSYKVIIEGIIYNFNDEELKKQLFNISKNFFLRNDFKKDLKEFVLNACGDYIIIISSSQHEGVLIFNDRWGRLPFHYLINGNSIIMSREIKFLLHYLNKIHFNKISILEYLTIRYPLGDRTLILNIKKLAPGNSILINDQKIKVECVLKIDFTKEIRFKDFNKNADEFSRIIIESTKKRLEKLSGFSSITVDLSGGYDSRAVFGALTHFDKKFIPNIIDMEYKDEVKVADMLAKNFNIDLLAIVPKFDLSFNTISEIIYLTDGVINGETATTGLQARKQLYEQLNKPIARFMGFGGEFIRHPLLYKGYMKNMVDIIKFVILSPTLIRSSCKCIKVKKKDLFSFWNNFFDEHYNERKLEDKLTRYYFDYYNILVGYGEDRARFRFWTINPMMSTKWLNLAIKEISCDFIGYEIFEELLAKIDPRISVEKIPIWGSSFVRSNLFKFINNSKFLLYVGKRLYSFKLRFSAYRSKRRKELEKEILKLYANSLVIQNIFDIKGIRKFLKTEYGPSNKFIWQLLTLFLYIQALENRFPNKFTND